MKYHFTSLLRMILRGIYLAEETIITLIVAGLSLFVSLTVLGLTIKRDALKKDILRERRLLEEAYGPLKGKIRRMAVLDIPESTISVDKNEKSRSILT